MPKKLAKRRVAGAAMKEPPEPEEKLKPPPLELLGLPSRIKLAREYAKLNQKQLAQLADVPAAVISRLENGKRLGNVSTRVVIGLARACNVPVGWMAAGELPPREMRIPTNPPSALPEVPDDSRSRITGDLKRRVKRSDGDPE